MAIARKTKAKPAVRYRLRIELAEITPVIWRQVWVEGHIRLVQLHHIIQAAMGWTDAHLHAFKIGDTRYGTPDPEDDPDYPLTDERTVQLDRILTPGLRFEYQYDFGDSWIHLVRVELVKALDQPYGAAAVEAGAGACPPEDSGGSFGYQAFLDKFAADPDDEEVESFFEWAGDDFNPHHFDRHAANAALLRMAWNQWGEK